MSLHSNRHRRALPLIIGACLVAVFGFMVVARSASPTAADDQYAVDANAALSVAAPGVLDNDGGVDLSTTRIAGYDARTRFGGRVVLGPNGALSYTPPVGFSGRDSFTYALDNPEGASQATVTLNVVGPATWFVNASAPAGGNGTFAAPFNSFAPLNATATDIDRPGDRIFVYPGSYSVSLALEADQTLIGAAAGLSLPASGLTIPPAARPQLSSAASTIVLAQGSTVRGIQAISNGAGTAAFSAGAIGGVTIADVVVPGAGGSAGAFALSGLTGPLTVSDSTVSGSYAAGATVISLTNSGAAGAVSFTNTPLTTSGGIALSVDNVVSLSFDSASDITHTGPQGIVAANLPAAANIGFAGVSITSSGGSASAVEVQAGDANALLRFTEGMSLSGAGYAGLGHRLSVSGTGSTIASGSNTPLTLSGAAIQGTAAFSSISASAASGGLLLSNTSGAVAVSTATLSTANGGELIRLDGGSASLTISGGTLTKSTLGAAVSVLNNHQGTLLNSAAVNVTGGDGFAFSDANGVYTQSGVATLNGGAARVAVSGGDGTITFSNAGSSIVAQNGQPGFTVTTSATSGSFAGTITKNTSGDRVVSVSGLAAGTSYSFSTVLANSASSGIAVSSAAGNISFGTLSLGSSAARFTVTPIALSDNSGAVNLGTVSAFSQGATALAYTGAGGGAISSTTGTIDTVSGTAISIAPSSGTQTLSMSLRTVNATNGTRGIQLTNTGGSFSIVGDGGANFTSGGTISSMSESGVRLQNATGVSLSRLSLTSANTATSGSCSVGGAFVCNGAVLVSGASGLSLDRVRVSGTSVDSALSGTGLSGLTVTNSEFDNVGAEADRSVFAFRRTSQLSNLVGTVLIENTRFTNFMQNGIDISNGAGTLGLTVRNVTFDNNIARGGGATCGKSLGCEGNGMVVDARSGGTVNVTVENAIFEEMDQRGVRLTVNGGTMSAVVRDSSFTPFPFSTNVADANSRWAERGISLGVVTGGQLTFNIQDNILTDHRVGAILVDAFDNGSSAVGAIRNNIVNRVAAGGVSGGKAIEVHGETGAPNLRVEVANNSLTNIGAGSSTTSGTVVGISVDGIGSAVMNYRVVGNTVSNSAPFSASHGIFMDATGTANMCLEATGNSATANTSTTPSNFGLRARKGSTATFAIQGFAGGDGAAVASYLSGTNTGTTSATGSAFTNSTCTFSGIPSLIP